jgi:hypothetical protein
LYNPKVSIGGGVDAYNSWRNKRFTFEIKEDDSDIDFVFKSKTTNCRMYVLNSAGNSIKYSDVGLYEGISPLNLKKGIYSLVVCAEEGKSNNFDLSIYSKSSVIVNASNINSSNFSKKNGVFNLAGGVDNFNSLTNPKFTFTANSTTYIDLVGNSSGLNSRIYLLNSAGNSIKYSGNSISNSIEQYQITSGTYTVVMCGEKDKNGSFDIILHSKDGVVSDLVAK